MDPLAWDDPHEIGNLQLLSKLGAGGFGRVYLGLSSHGHLVAVKVVHPDLAQDPRFRERFKREIKAIRSVGGEFTASVVAAGPDDTRPWFAMDYVPGPSLHRIVEETGPLPATTLWWIAARAAEALRSIHAAQLLHRDLKPANILISRHGLRVLDFGISRTLDGTRITLTSITMGTWGFMPLEQVEDPHGVDTPADVFALGATLTFAGTGHPPYSGTHRQYFFQLMAKPPDLSGLPDELTKLVTGCLAQDPRQRPTIDEVLAYAVPHLDRVRGDDISGLLPPSVMALIDGEETAVARVHRRARVQPSAGPLPEAWPLPEPQGIYAEILSRYERTSDQEDTWTGLGAVRSVVAAARVGMRVAVLLVIVVVAWRFISDRVGSGQDGPSRDANVLWRAGRMDGVGPANWSSPAGPATLVGGVLYTATRDGNVVRALDARTGRVLWSHNQGSGQSSLEALAPSVSDGIVTGTDGSTVYALDAKSGKRKWQHPWKDQTEGIGPVAGGGVVAVADPYGGVTAYSAKTGATAWKRNLDLVGDKLRDLAAATDRLYLVSDYRLASLRLDTGRILWSAVVGSGLGNNTASSIAGVLGDRVIIEGGEWVEARSTSGGGRLWRVPLSDVGAFWPLVSTQAIIIHLCELSCQSDTKVIPPHEVALDPASGKRLWSANVELPISNLPPSEWIQGGLLLRWPTEGGSERGIKAVSARSGKVLKTWQVTETKPRFVLSDRRRLYIVDYDTRTMAMRR